MNLMDTVYQRCINPLCRLINAPCSWTPKISRGDLARVLILASQENIASRKTFDLFSSKGVAPSDQQILEQIEQIPADI